MNFAVLAPGTTVIVNRPNNRGKFATSIQGVILVSATEVMYRVKDSFGMVEVSPGAIESNEVTLWTVGVPEEAKV